LFEKAKKDTATTMRKLQYPGKPKAVKEVAMERKVGQSSVRVLQPSAVKKREPAPANDSSIFGNVRV
jgi:hypothetical protein